MRESRIILLTLIVVGFQLVAGCGKKTQKPTSVWNKPSTTYEEACTEECESVSTLAGGHGRSDSIPVLYDPDLDDSVAQWGDCLDSVLRCRATGGGWDSCVADSICPATCIKEFKITSGDRKAVFEQVFVNEGGLCVPADGELE